jgi:proteasome lid subunit RPN8/RPN11
MTGEIRIRAAVFSEILRQARLQQHIECCGLLAGRDGVITEIFPARNSLASPTRYEIAPRDLFQIFRDLRAGKLTHLGQYHSHLSSENVPSPTDIEQAGYPEQAYFIVSLREDAANPIRAFSIHDGLVEELQVIVTNTK